MKNTNEQLNEDWKPDFGKIAVMVNNCWGDLSKSLL